MDLFPIGLVGSTSKGTLNSISYSLFEPNNGCKSFEQFNNLVNMFETQTMTTRQKALPILSIEYTYNNIYDREFRQMEHFLYSVASGKLNPFYAVDWSRGQKFIGDGAFDASTNMTVTNSIHYSATTNYKSNWVLVWSGYQFKIGTIIAIPDAVTIRADFTSSNLGNLTYAKASSMAIIYPIYEVYSTVENLQEFSVQGFADNKFVSPQDSGYMRSGSILFVSKYKI